MARMGWEFAGTKQTMKRRLAYITGSNGQLGIAIAAELKQHDWILAGIDTAGDSSNAHIDHFFTGSVCKKTDVRDFFKSSQDILCDLDLEGISLINNAGVAVFTPSEERTESEFDYVTKVNLLGPTYCTTLFKELVENNSPEIIKTVVNISSIYGLQSPNSSIYTDTARNSSEVYGASKAGVIQLTKYFACKYAENGISINCVAPGGVLNEELQGPGFIGNYSSLVPMRRLCNSDEVAKLVYFLAEGSVKYLTAQVIALDGGMGAW